MRGVISYTLQFFIYVFVQALIVGPLEFGWGIHPMVYPLFILMLPFQMGTIQLMLIAFAMGLSVDFFANTFGLHTSAAVMLAYFRKDIFNLFAPRDGYDNFVAPSLQELGYIWFIAVAGILTTIHHLWFFFLEIFRFDAWLLIVRNTLLSSIVTVLLYLLIQLLFFKRTKAT